MEFLIGCFHLRHSATHGPHLRRRVPLNFLERPARQTILPICNSTKLAKEARFEFRGKQFQKVAMSMALDAERNGNVFQGETEITPIGEPSTARLSGQYGPIRWKESQTARDGVFCVRMLPLIFPPVKFQQVAILADEGGEQAFAFEISAAPL
jgi:hypothetical protein